MSELPIVEGLVLVNTYEEIEAELLLCIANHTGDPVETKIVDVLSTTICVLEL